jgi:hypothetical protein
MMTQLIPKVGFKLALAKDAYVLGAVCRKHTILGQVKHCKSSRDRCSRPSLCQKISLASQRFR